MANNEVMNEVLLHITAPYWYTKGVLCIASMCTPLIDLYQRVICFYCLDPLQKAEVINIGKKVEQNTSTTFAKTIYFFSLKKEVMRFSFLFKVNPNVACEKQS